MLTLMCWHKFLPVDGAKRSKTGAIDLSGIGSLPIQASKIASSFGENLEQLSLQGPPSLQNSVSDV